MLKSKAIELLGGTTTAASEAIGVSYQAVDKWPEILPRRIEDRVLAAQARKYLPPELLGLDLTLVAGCPPRPESAPIYTKTAMHPMGAARISVGGEGVHA